MAWDDVLGFIVVIALLVIPSLGLTARFALKPIVESMLRIREALDRSRAPAEDPRLAALETRLDAMQETLERVAQAVDFHAQLGAPPPRPVISVAPGPGTGPRLMRPASQAPAAGTRTQPLLHPADYEEEYL